MTILLVLLTFLVTIAITYFVHRGQPMVPRQVRSFRNAAAPHLLRDHGFEVPQGYCFHPGHTWVLDEGRQNARVGLDRFAANLIGKIDHVEVSGLNRWVRQGQKVWSITRNGMTIEMVSPIEGVMVAINPEVQNDPNLITKDPYQDGWVCMIQAPDLAINLRNLLRGNLIVSWMQNAVRRVGEMAPQTAGATLQDGGLPIVGVLAQVDSPVQRAMIKEFFLTDERD